MPPVEGHLVGNWALVACAEASRLFPSQPAAMCRECHYTATQWAKTALTAATNDLAGLASAAEAQCVDAQNPHIL